jgi:hypothetical protein
LASHAQERPDLVAYLLARADARHSHKPPVLDGYLKATRSFTGLGLRRGLAIAASTTHQNNTALFAFSLIAFPSHNVPMSQTFSAIAEKIKNV